MNIMVTPSALGYQPAHALPGAPPGWAFHVAPPDARDQFLVTRHEPFSFREPARPYVETPAPIALEGRLWSRSERTGRRERRRLARANGRRWATRVPVLREWHTAVYAPEGTPEHVLRAAAAIGVSDRAPTRVAYGYHRNRRPRWRASATSAPR